MNQTDKYFVIVNPASGNGKVAKKWDSIRVELQKHLDFEFQLTEYPYHGEKIAITAIEMGYRKIIGVGGDGLLQEISNGILNQSGVPSADVTVALLSNGTGNDWIKTSAMPGNLTKAIETIKRGKTIAQDVGKVTFTKDGVRQTRYCVNFAGVGFDSYVVAKTLHLKKYGAIAYLLGMLQCLFSYKKPVLKISSAEHSVTTACYLCITGIGKFGGGGMKLMPGALLNDGLFFVSVAKNLSRMKVITNIHKLYSGDLVHMDEVDAFETKKINIEVVSSDQDVYIEADGEVLGTGPFEIEIVPAVLTVVVREN